MDDEHEAMRASGFGPYPVTVVSHFMIPMSDDVHLAVKFWFPTDQPKITEEYFGDAKNYLLYPGKPENLSVVESTFPVILEYLPYRKSDFTVGRDYRRHPWMASHGYVVARVDFRGAGDSEGLYFGEYLPQEQKDACDVIAWFCAQMWCNGKVGMYGKSWGGFNGLQVAYEQPPGLAAIISVYSSDDRYLLDIHWDAGCVLGGGMLPWAARMFLWNCTPPNPQNISNWKEEWHKRLQNASECWVKSWLSHQTRDDYWRHGSINMDFSRVQCPVLAIGGWRDCYTDAVFRMVRNMENVTGIIGPWPHEWPDVATPGPNIEYMEVCLQWWDYHLKGKDNGAEDLPRLRIFMQDSVPPSPNNDFICPGKWVVEPSWPPFEANRYNTFIPGAQGVLHLPDDAPMDDEIKVPVKYTSASGQWAGEWLSFGAPDGPGDQQTQDAISTSWTSSTLNEELGILGFPLLKTKVVAESDRACLAVRLCDVFPDGQSTLITYGLYNVCHHRGYDEGMQERLVPGKEYPVTIELHSAGYTLQPGHRLRLGVSTGYWPTMWPSPYNSDIHLVLGQAQRPKSGVSMYHTQLLLPTVLQSTPVLNIDGGSFVPKSAPKLGPVLPSIRLQEVEKKFELLSSFSFAENEYVRSCMTDTGPMHLQEHGSEMVYREISVDRYSIKEVDPLSASVKVHGSLVMHWPCAINNAVDANVEIQAISEMKACQENFYLTNKVHVLLNGNEEYKNEWHDTVTRQFV